MNGGAVLRDKREGRDGAQHAGIVRGFGGTKALRDLGSKRKLADRNNAAVVKVIANDTANRNWRAVCG